MKPLLMTLTLALISLVSVGCGKRDEGRDEVYDVKGKVVSVDTAKKSVQLDHEDIPGLMKGMVMRFEVQDAKILEGFKPDDQVHGRLQVKDGRYTIIKLHKMKSP